MKKLLCSIFGHAFRHTIGYTGNQGEVHLETIPHCQTTVARVKWVCPRCHTEVTLGRTRVLYGESYPEVEARKRIWDLEKDLRDARRAYRDYRNLMEAPLSPAVTSPPTPPQKKVDELQKSVKMEGSTSKGVQSDSSDPLLDPAVSVPLYWGFSPSSSGSSYGGDCSSGESSSSSSDSGSCSSE